MRTVSASHSPTRLPTRVRLHPRRTVGVLDFAAEAEILRGRCIDVAACRARPTIPGLFSPLLSAAEVLRLPTLTAAPDLPLPSDYERAEDALKLALLQLLCNDFALIRRLWTLSLDFRAKSSFVFCGTGQDLGLGPGPGLWLRLLSAMPLRFPWNLPYVCRLRTRCRKSRRREEVRRSWVHISVGQRSETISIERACSLTFFHRTPTLFKRIN